MADGLIGNAARALGEAVVKPVSDEVGKMVEDGVQSITGKQNPGQKKQNSPDPAQIAQDDAAKKRKALVNIAQFIQQMTQNSANLKAQNEQKELIRNQDEERKVQTVRQFEFDKKQKMADQREIDLQRAKTRTENKIAGAG